jgi:hypothetical protein
LPRTETRRRTPDQLSRFCATNASSLPPRLRHWQGGLGQIIAEKRGYRHEALSHGRRSSIRPPLIAGAQRRGLVLAARFSFASESCASQFKQKPATEPDLRQINPVVVTGFIKVEFEQ